MQSSHRWPLWLRFSRSWRLINTIEPTSYGWTNISFVVSKALMGPWQVMVLSMVCCEVMVLSMALSMVPSEMERRGEKKIGKIHLAIHHIHISRRGAEWTIPISRPRDYHFMKFPFLYVFPLISFVPLSPSHCDLKTYLSPFFLSSSHLFFTISSRKQKLSVKCWRHVNPLKAETKRNQTLPTLEQQHPFCMYKSKSSSCRRHHRCCCVISQRIIVSLSLFSVFVLYHIPKSKETISVFSTYTHTHTKHTQKKENTYV